ncbi:DHHA1 domain-containing protein [Metallibacterium scheffleri]|nr:DHHA1 domain-containing protein [Metallibacterium scheffleri]
MISPLRLVLRHSKYERVLIRFIASKLVERYGVPAICLSVSEEGEGCMTGSVRSVEGVHIKAVLDRIAGKHPEIGLRYGGHAMAAGVRMPLAQVAAFDLAWQEAVGAAMVGVERPWDLHDGSLAGLDPRKVLAEVEALEPFGKGFPSPVFCDQAVIERCQPMKPDSPHLTLHVTFKPPACVRVVWFNGAASAATLGLRPGQRVELMYELARSDYAMGPGYDRLVRDVAVMA